ncbi:unnamed protein product [Closterium sp. NIES-53]
MRERRALKSGRLSRQGVTCDCCGRMFNLSGFEAHTGVTYRRPAANMFLEDGRTLAVCKMEAERSAYGGGVGAGTGASAARGGGGGGVAVGNGTVREAGGRGAAGGGQEEGKGEGAARKVVRVKGLGSKVKGAGGEVGGEGAEGEGGAGERSDYSDVLCRLCGDGGELLCCDACPATLHLPCAGLQALPGGNWFCPACRCSICGGSHYGTQGFGDDTVIFCDQCEREYHVSCLRDMGWADLKELPTGRFFCRPQCRTVFFGLQRLIGKPISLPGGFSWTLLHAEGPRSEAGSVTKEERRHDSLLRERTGEVERKLRCGMEVMRECFHPIKDAFTGEDLVPIIVHSKSTKHRDYSGFYTAVLQQGKESITAASIRVYGCELAEMPLIGTRRCHVAPGLWLC